MEHIETDNWTSVFSAAEMLHARDVALVLEARAIPNRIERDGSRWIVIVPLKFIEQARAEVLSWHAENSRPRGGERRLEAIGSGWPGVIAWVTVLAVCAVASTRQLFGYDWYTLGNAHAAAIVGGEYWRTMTALMLHADNVHLLGNIVFGSFFGFSVGRYLGEGFGWSLILLGGIFGNALNALLQSPLHRSVGASTAVFAALGILTVYRWRRGFEPGTSWRVRFAPLYAGVALLAFTGTAGESTDLGAHLFGFLSGLVLGLVATRLVERIGRNTQFVLAAACLAGCAIAWQLAFSS